MTTHKRSQSEQQQRDASAVRSYKPYFAPAELQQLTALSATTAQNRVEDRRQQACAFILAVSANLGFPRRTAATAQLLYHRFHLYFHLRDFSYHDVSLAALLVASKLEDTLKKLKDIQIAGHHVKVSLEGASLPPEPDLHVIDYERGKLIGIERLILETVSFSFNLHFGAPPGAGAEVQPPIAHDVFSYIIKIAQHMQLSKDFTKVAFQLGMDAHRSLTPLTYPAHVIALACFYLGANLDIELESPRPDVAFDDAWAKSYCASLLDIQEVAHAIIDVASCAPLYLGSTAKSANTSPLENTSPAEPGRPSLSSSGNWENALFQLKIHLRQREVQQEEGEQQQEQPSSPKRARIENSVTAAAASQAPLTSDDLKSNRSLLGRDDLTVRFQFNQ